MLHKSINKFNREVEYFVRLLAAILCIVLLPSAKLCSQTKQMDSLNRLLQTAQEDTAQVRVLMRLSALNDNDSVSYEYAKRALNLSLKLNYPTGQWKAMNNIGLHFTHVGNYQESLKVLKEALVLCRKDNNENGIASILNNIGNDYMVLGYFSSSLPCFLEVLKLKEASGDKVGVANMLRSVGDIHHQQGQYKEAGDYYKRSLQLALTIQNAPCIISGYDRMAGVSTEMHQYKEAMEYCRLSLARQKTEPVNMQELVSVYVNMAEAYKGEQNIRPGIQCLWEARRLAQKDSDMTAMSYIYRDLGNLYELLPDYDSSLYYLNKGVNLESSKANRVVLCDFYLCFSKTYAGKKDYQEAYHYHELFYGLNDSLFNETKSRELNELLTKYDTEKKEEQIGTLLHKSQIQQLQLSRDRYLTLGLIALFLIILLIVFLQVSRRRLRMKNAEIVMEQKILRLQMTPHFIFNSMMSIQHYVRKHQADEAARYINSFARLIRMILENSRSEYVLLETELATVKYYLELQQINYPDKFEYRVEIDPDLDPEMTRIPHMLIQPIIENAIEHGILHKKDGKGYIEVQFTEADACILVRVVDNGIGRKGSELLNAGKKPGHVSMATHITQERIRMLNKKLKKKMIVFTEDLIGQDGQPSGTAVTVRLPISGLAPV
ncbi:MAG TPA: tetratricopeptide repeat protein [Bacteroidia bacterium]|jgi:tetratricopeptide (TPR) repeat protein|nr:tetratricopeptide repeat protein [Bacteroidia bacterium]